MSIFVRLVEYISIDSYSSGHDLLKSIPSSKVIIQKSIEKLEASWSQMQSVWSTRNILYEKNLDLRVCGSFFNCCRFYAQLTIRHFESQYFLNF